MTRHFASPEGVYLGGFDGVDPPAGAIETPAPSSGTDTWNGIAWVPDFAKLRAAEFKKFRDDREMFLNRLMGIAGRLARAGNTTIAANADYIAEQLIALTSDSAVVAATDIDTLKAAMKARYTVIVSAADPALYSAFKQVDA